MPRAPAADLPVPLHYEERGHGPPVLVLHGLFGSSSNWRSFAKRLADCMRVMTVGLRNHGRSPHADRHDYPSMAADIVALDALAISRTSLVGHSMGGKAAMKVAVTRPERVERLVVLDIGPRPTVDGVRDVLEALLHVDLGNARSREDVDAQLAMRLPDAALRSFLLMGLIRAEGGRFRWKVHLNAIAANWDAISADVARERYEGPVLFVRGEHSDYIRDADVPAILARFPHARIETIPGARHWLLVEAPDETSRVVREFLCDAEP